MFSTFFVISILKVTMKTFSKCGVVIWIYFLVFRILGKHVLAEEMASSVKSLLIRSLFENDQELFGKRNVSVNLTEILKKDVPYKDRSVTSRTADDTNEYIFEFPDGFRIPRLRTDLLDFKTFHHTLNPINEANEPVLIQMVEWRGIMLLAQCYETSCEIFKGVNDSELKKAQTISFSEPPAQVKFYSEQTHLYAIIVSDLSVIYRWEENYFDAVQTLDTDNANGVDIIHAKGRTIMVFAQDKLSKVYLKNRNRMEYIQNLDCSAVNVVKYNVNSNHGEQHYVLMLSRDKQSNIYWWNGKQFLKWSEILTNYNFTTVFQAEIDAEPFLFISNKNFVSIYHAELNNLTLKRTLALDGEVTSLRVENSKLVFLLSKPSGDRQILIVSFMVSKENLTDFFKESPITCLKVAFEKLKSRRKTLDNLRDQKKNFLTLGKKETINNVTVAGKTIFNNVEINKVVVNAENVILQDTPVNIMKKLVANEKNLKKLQKKILQLESKNKSITIKGLLRVKTLFADALNVTKLNGKILDMKNYLSYNEAEDKKNLTLASVYVTNLITSSLNDHSPQELMQKNLKRQVHTGEVKATNVFAENVKFGEISSINQIEINKLVTSEPTNIKGFKQFSYLNTEYLNSSKINNMSPESFIDKVLPIKYLSDFGNHYHTDNLNVEYLKVENINSMPWEEYFRQTYCENCAREEYNITNLNADKINGIAVANFLNKIDNQNVSSELHVKTLKANKLKFKNCNNGSLAQLILSKISIERPILIKGNLNTSSIHFDKPLQIGNTSVNISKMEVLVENENFDNNSYVEKSNTTSRGNERVNENELSVDGKKVIKKVVIIGDVFIKSSLETKTINGENPATLLRDIFIIGRDEITEMQQFSNLVLGNITLAKVNGQELKRSENISFSNMSIPHVIFKSGNNSERQSKTFSKLEVQENIYGKINDVDFSSMSKQVLSKSKSDEITGHFEINNLNGRSINVSTINDVKMELLLFNNKNETQTIYSNLTLNELAAFQNLNLISSLFQCPIEKVKNMDFSEVLDFDYIEAVGNISWDENSSDSDSVSSIFSKAVSRSKNNSISAPVIFKKTAEIQDLETHHDINNVNISFIAKDAVLSSINQQVINCEAILRNVSAVNVNISSDLSVDSIGGVDIIQLDKRLVKKSKLNTTITGLKYFHSDLKCYRLKAENIHGTNFSNVVFLEDLMNSSNTRVLPPTKFRSLDINYNMTVDYINNLSLDNFKKQIIYISQDENITEKFVFNGNLQADKLNVAKINDVKLIDTVLCSGNNQTIEGKKSFYNSVVQLEGDIKVGSVYENDLMSAYKNSLKTGENATINNNVIFEADLIVNGNVNSKLINSCNITKLYQTEESFSPKYIQSKNRIKTKEEYLKIEHLLKEPKKETIFKHLENYITLDLKLENVQSTSTQRTSNNTINVEIYGMSFDACGLENSCMCPRQYTISFGDSGMNISQKKNRTYYYYQESLNVSVKILTNSVSYKSRCQANEIDEITEISYATANNSHINLSTLRSGYLSDVKFFRLDESIYIILAFLYNGKGNDTHSGKVSIFELRTSAGDLVKVEDLDAEGAMIVDVIWASPSYILIVANLRANETSSESVHSQVYYFNEKQNKFALMKNIRTHGVTNIKAVRMGKESFIFIVQKNPWPLLAFKYSNENENFYFSEKLYRQAGFYSVNALPLSDDPAKDLYLGVVFMDGQFVILKYKHIEGLGEETTVKQENVQALQYFTWKSHSYLLAVSADAPSYIYQVVVQNQ